MTVLERVDAYLDAVPRSAADAFDVGAFTVFVNRDPEGWPYYARPRRGAGDIGLDDVVAARECQRDAGVPESFEWVHALRPTLAQQARESGLEVVLHPLLVLDRVTAAGPGGLARPNGATLRLVRPDDEAAVLAGALVGDLAFAAAGTDVGPTGVAELRAGMASPEPVTAARAAASSRRLAAGAMVQAVAEVDGDVVAVGWHQPVYDVVTEPGGTAFAATEIVGVATLPSARRQGLAAAVTALLTADALQRGCELVLLSASSDAVARVYERIGFVRVGHAGAAEPPAPDARDGAPERSNER